MTLRIIDSTNLQAEEILPLWPDIVSCLVKYCARFPKEETVEHMIEEIATGSRRMWLVIDEEGRVVLVPVTAIETIEATGLKQLLLAECAGSRLAEAMPLLDEIEDWAKREHAIDRVRFIGRKGWTGYLTERGYKPVAVIFEKEF